LAAKQSEQDTVNLTSYFNLFVVDANTTG